MQLDEIRRRFLTFFESKGHAVCASSSLVPKNDPTLLFTNAGMVQFKDYFLGSQTPEFKKATTCQLCIRAGGKHNDLENVGKTARHHTFFEMLGNFSFGDYFKEKAIHYAWEFLTRELKIPKKNLYVSVYEEDKEAYQIWHKKIKIEPKRIYKFGKKDNFWAMGDTGPCGPCSEIYYDQGETVGCGKKTCDVGCECDRYIEIWNLVFMEFERTKEGILTPLPKPSIDTGMGLERLASVLQGVQSNYDIDLFQNLIRDIEKTVSRKYGENSDSDISLRVIADHIRSTTFLISEGVLPSNEGRGYVLRRIMRRAIRHGKKLGQDAPFLYKLVSSVVDLMNKSYPQLKEQKPFIEKVIFSEEERFLKTLDNGLKILEGEILKHHEQKKKILSGETIYKLYDTFGFPIDLISVLAQEQKLTLDMSGFETYMNEQRTRARSKWVGSGEKKENPLYQELSKKIKCEFLGYETFKTSSKLKAIIFEGQRVDLLHVKDQPLEVELIFDKTPFYGESGGQVGDTGVIKAEKVEIEITDTQKPYLEFIVHRGKLIKGELQVGKSYELQIDCERRHDIVLNHTATHMLHTALQEQLGDHVRQAGSLVAPDRLRFDFTHFQPLTPLEIENLENFMNDKIAASDPVTVTVMSFKDAMEIGAMALFGDKYEDRVRVIQVGDYSIELCGGTHLHSTSQIRLFKIISETGVSAGIRRIEALTGKGAFQYLKTRDEKLGEIELELKTKASDVPHRVKSLLERTKELERELSKSQDKRVSEESKDLLSQVKEKNGVKILAAVISASDISVLRTYCDTLRDRLKSGIIVLGAEIQGRAVLVSAVTKDLTSTYSAHDIIQKLSPLIGGKGGGRADLAQAGGPDISHLNDAIQKAFEKV
ncbi:MAG: alanine--tRNA ligase [Deltaproteobacteria bacterium RIFCSPHIGHO2_02_FULL_38_15]|nr:MAG: alanine--tRNA ligase [Deltaproteobacteria bacterium RIFCSPHIGHO2_02_FULL_38_15]OGQ59551.1 MAG: alanine--tRNA ligase [Deltaproteobacteria bacterium RIFCSPLOWO2_12_FULL_38_8]HBQ20655.1 alanine--tRNA ligase [Deltaproteobacteria bacterium]